MSESFIDKLAWIHLVDRKILSTLTKGKDVYYIPGGKREKNETDQEALVREIKEELSVDLIPGTIKYVGAFEAEAHGHEGLIVQMTCYSADYEGVLTHDSEIEEMVWFEHQDKDKSSAVDKIIFDWLKEQDLID